MNCSFTSDNTSGVHPLVMQALNDVNQGDCKPYGNDEYSREVVEIFRKLFTEDTNIHFALNGTGANVLVMRSILRAWQGIICADTSHLNTEEVGAVEANSGSKLLLYPSVNGKLTPEGILHYIHDLEDEHHSRPAMVSIAQTTEQGTVYSVEEIKAIVSTAHKYGLYVHMDGSRIANAVAALNVNVKEFTCDAGIDVLSFGGTKNGLMMGEAVVYFNKNLGSDFFRMRKQSMQHISKMRYIAAQFLAYFKNDLWIENARHANSMAQYMAQELEKVPNISISRKTEANAVFAIMQPEAIKKLQEKYYFYELNPHIHEVRFMCSFATTKEKIDAFIKVAIECQK